MELTCKTCGERFLLEKDALEHEKKTGHHTFKFRTAGRIVSVG